MHTTLSINPETFTYQQTDTNISMEPFEEISEESISLYPIKESLRDSILEIAKECSSPDWDGYNAVSINGATLKNAYDFISKIICENVPLCCYPEPDGAISFEWTFKKNTILSISIDNTNNVPYAWINDTENGSGVDILIDDDFPQEIKRIIDRFIHINE